MKSNARALALVIALGFGIAACGGGGGGSSRTSSSAAGGDSGSSSGTTANAARFCHDYGAATLKYQLSVGDVTDPDFGKFVDLLDTAKNEAPDAVKGDVTDMWSQAKDARNHDSSGDLSSDSRKISRWARSNCL